MKVKKAMRKAAKATESSDSDSEYNSSDDEVSNLFKSKQSYLKLKLPLTSLFSRVQLREAFAKGLLKPGLNTVTEEINKQHKNCVVSMIR